MIFERPLIAIDIGSASIKLVELSGGPRRRLRSVGLEVLPTGAVVDGQLQDSAIVEETIKKLMARLGVKPLGRRVALGLSGSSVLIKKVSIAASEDKELAEQVYYEAEQHLQVDMADIYFDHSKLGEPSAAGATTPVLIVGAKRDLVEKYLGLVRSLGMRTGVVDCGIFAASNMLEYNYGILDGITILINVGASVSTLTLKYQDQYMFSRDIPIGGDEYSRRIMELMNIDHENAETIKVAASQGEGDAPPEVTRLMGEVNEQLVHEVQMAIDYFLQSGEAPPEVGLSAVYLTGGGSRVLGLDAALAASLELPVQVVNPFQRVEIDQKRVQMDYVLMQGHLYGVAVGLALRSMNDGHA